MVKLLKLETIIKPPNQGRDISWSLVLLSPARLGVSCGSCWQEARARYIAQEAWALAGLNRKHGNLTFLSKL